MKTIAIRPRPWPLPMPAVLALAMLISFLGSAVLAPIVAQGAAGATFHVAATGDDANDGLSIQSPWRSLARVNASELRPGDKVCFKRGDSWRGQLVPRSGRENAPVTYGAYGEGDKALLLGSVSRNDPRDWQHEGGNVWTTAKPTFTERAPLSDFAAAPWAVHTEGSAKARTTTLKPEAKGRLPVWRIECSASGTSAGHIQLYNRGLSIKEGDYYEFFLRVRSTKPFTLGAIALMKQTAPFTSYGSVGASPLALGSDWTDCTVRFKATQTAGDGRITIGLGGMLPAGAVFEFQPVSWKRLHCGESEALAIDVGNIIFDHGQSVGVKQWTLADLKRSGDYWYCGDTWQVKLYSERNPAEHQGSIELALCRHIVDQGGKSHVTYENLALRYGAAHGIGGGSTHHITVRDCDISYIGGGHQFTTPEGRPVRFGNGIEFWENAHDNLVEGCRIWEVYDAALTNQGRRDNSQVNLTYRHNVIWNCEYSFEYWNRGPESQTRNVRFEHNTCVNAGFGWGHAQRPDRNGRHLMFGSNPARTSEFYVRNNIFCGATESGPRISNDWTAGLTMDHNCWFQPAGAPLLLLHTTFTAAQFADYQKQYGLDAHSIVADPKFVAPGKLDFRLADDSPARRCSTEGGPVGALRRPKE
jgi:hypothetical protein